MAPAYQAITDKYPKLNQVQRINHMGTPGTGTHFIEVCLDESENVWFLLHLGFLIRERIFEHREEIREGVWAPSLLHTRPRQL